MKSIALPPRHRNRIYKLVCESMGQVPEQNFDRDLTSDELAAFLFLDQGIPLIEFPESFLEAPAVTHYPAELCRTMSGVLLVNHETSLIYGTCNPFDKSFEDKLRSDFPSKEIHALGVLPTHFQHLLNQQLSTTADSSRNFDGIVAQSRSKLDTEWFLDKPADALDECIFDIIKFAISQRGTDIHWIAKGDKFQVLVRIDSFLVPFPTELPSDFSSNIDIKFLRAVNFDEDARHLPLSGAILAQLGSANYELRYQRENLLDGGFEITTRLQDRSREIPKLGKKGQDFHPLHLKYLLELTGGSYGMFLISGPVNSGKSTTLYSLIAYHYESSLKFITLEDPVEFRYAQPNICQSEMKGKTAEEKRDCVNAWMSSTLRRDANVVIPAELRDNSSILLAVEVSNTGSRCWSTIHAQSNGTLFERLRTNGIRTTQFIDTLRGVASQRLVPLLCDCATEHTVPTPDEMLFFGLDPDWKDRPLRRARRGGCPKCRNTGYYGLHGVLEVLPLLGETRELVAREAPGYQIERQSREEFGLPSLLQCALVLVADDKTDLHAVRRKVL